MMEEKKDIDFIKWCEPYTDYIFEKNLTGFNITKEGITCGWEFNGKTYGYKLLYGDFLQRVIEGVNYDHIFHISQMNDTIEVYKDDDAYDVLMSVRFHTNTADQAKEASLKYIYEQETP